MKFLMASIILTITSTLLGDISPGNQILDNYSNVQYSLARNLARKYPKLPESRLVTALCAVFDHRKQDLRNGLLELKRIYQDKSLNDNIRLQAGLSYARAAQTLQMRSGLYPVVDHIDFNAIYDKIMHDYPDRPEACFAVIYKAQSLFDSNGEKYTKQAFSLLKSFLKHYQGPKTFLAPINMLLAYRYVINYGDYHKYVEYMTAALAAGIANPQTRENILISIGRTYSIKLKNKLLAQKYYRQYLREYPNSSNVPIIKRYLCRLSERGEK